MLSFSYRKLPYDVFSNFKPTLVKESLFCFNDGIIFKSKEFNLNAMELFENNIKFLCEASYLRNKFFLEYRTKDQQKVLLNQIENRIPWCMDEIFNNIIMNYEISVRNYSDSNLLEIYDKLGKNYAIGSYKLNNQIVHVSGGHRKNIDLNKIIKNLMVIPFL